MNSINRSQLSDWLLQLTIIGCLLRMVVIFYRFVEEYDMSVRDGLTNFGRKTADPGDWES